MSRVTMLAQISGTRDGADWPRPGESLDVPEAEARDLVTAGLAKPAAPDAERAIKDVVVERAVVRPKRKD